MKELACKIIDIFLKKMKSGEKEQEAQIYKIEFYKNWILVVGLIFVIICCLNEIFPSLEISPWWYSTTEKILRYILGGN